jgi:ketosteroid isomerase-like protein
MNNYNTILKYFNLFSNKDLSGLSELFDDNVTLTDWEISAIGKEKVLECNSNIFKSAQSLKVDVLEILQKDLTFACQLIITVNSKEKLEVIDFIKFNQSGKIISVKAYKG